MEHHIEIQWARRRKPNGEWTGHNHYVTTYEGVEIGRWRVPECDAARWLRDNAGAADTDTLITHRPAEDGSTRNGAPCMRGSIGWFAAMTVQENEKVSPRFATYHPFEGPATVRGLEKDGQDGLALDMGVEADG